MNSKKAILVMGMHRCGTSAFTGCLNSLGFNIGKNLMGATEYNPKGHFENMAVFELNEWLLKISGSSWDETSPHINITIDKAQQIEFDKRVFSILENQYDNEEVIVIKDPRFSLLGKLWIQTLKKHGYNSYAVIMKRHPGAVLNSLYNRDSFSYEKGGNIYLNYLLSALYQNPLYEKSVLIDFRDLRERTSQVLHGIFDSFDLSYREFSDSINFLDPKLVHTKLDNYSLDHVPLLVSDFYGDLNSTNIGDIVTRYSLRYDKLFTKATLVDLKYEEVQSSNTKLKDELSSKSKIMVSHELEIGRLRDQNEAEIEALNKAIAESMLFLDNATLKINTLQEKLDVLQNENRDLVKAHSAEIAKLNKAKAIRENELLDILENSNILNEEELMRAESNSDVLKSKVNQIKKDYIEIKEKREEEVRVFADEKNSLVSEMAKLNHSLEKSHTANRSIEVQAIHFEELYSELMNSKSKKLGFILSFPFRLVYESLSFFNVKFIKLIPVLLSEAFKNPKLLIKAIKPANLRKLKYAIAIENADFTKNNIREYFSHLNRIESVVENGDSIIYNIDEIGKLEKLLIIRGWAISKAGISYIKISNDDEEDVVISYGRNRPDVAIVYPSHVDSKESGFYFKSEWKGNEVKFRIESKDGNAIEQIVPIKKLEDWSSLSLNEQYQLFIERNRSTQTVSLDVLAWQPLISIVIPVYNVEAKWLKKCVDSVLAQKYENWELCLYDDCSTDKETLSTLKEMALYDKRIKVGYGDKNQHIVYATNKAIEMSTGAYVGFMDNDDELTEDALFEIVCALNKNNELRLLYSDEDKIEVDGRLVEPHFKSDFNLDMIRSNNYISHFTVVERSIGSQVDWLTPGTEGSQDHDFILKVIDVISVDDILHIPKVLYHWRKIPGSTAVAYGDKNYAYKSGVKALSNHLKRNSLLGTIEKGLWPGSYRVRYKIDGNPSVSIIIPFKDEPELLERCMKSIKNKTLYNNYEIVLIDNGSKLDSTKNLLKELVTESNVRILLYDVPFNYSRINNWAVAQTESDFILLLNNDIEVISKGWLTSMLELGIREDVGAVGAKLLYDDDTIQHAGVILGIGGVAGHSHKYLHSESSGYFSRHNTIQNLSACTAACLLVKTELFRTISGLDEEYFKVAFNDIDLCLKIRQAGYLIAYTPYAKLYHYESKSRGLEDTPEKLQRFKSEVELFKLKWAAELRGVDPYYNENLSLEREDFSLRLS